MFFAFLLLLQFKIYKNQKYQIQTCGRTFCIDSSIGAVHSKLSGTLDLALGRELPRLSALRLPADCDLASVRSLRKWAALAIAMEITFSACAPPAVPVVPSVKYAWSDEVKVRLRDGAAELGRALAR